MPQNVGSIEDLIRQTGKDDTHQWVQVTIKITRFWNIAYTPFLKDSGTVSHWLIKIPGGIRQLAREFWGASAQLRNILARS